MHLLYLIALFPLLIGFVLWLANKEVALWEWICGAALSFLIAGITHLAAIDGVLEDIQTLSGQVTTALRVPYWGEYYEYAVYRTEYYTDTEYTIDSKGRIHSHTVTHSRRVFDHWEPAYRTHSETNTFYTNLGQSIPVSHQDLQMLAVKFGPNPITHENGVRRTSDHNSRMTSGDPIDYRVNNRSGHIEPVTKLVTWENRLKAGPSVFSYGAVPDTVKVYDWPENPNIFSSNRLLGLTGPIQPLVLDQMNARLGFKKKVNVIMIGFGNKSQEIAHYQEAKWFGGKKNDLVICFGGPDTLHPSWVYVFGWTEKGIVKKNIESLILDKGIDILPDIEQEIIANYTIRDWHQFDYMKIQPKTSTIVWFCIITFLTQTGFYIYASYNQFNKDGTKYMPFPNYR